jgi:hypothetical protein
MPDRFLLAFCFDIEPNGITRTATGTTMKQNTIFYAWQNDTHPDCNRYFIRDALKQALAQLSQDELFCLSRIWKTPSFGLV